MLNRLPFFYGWVIVAGCFATLSVSAGLGFYAASVILSAAASELDASIRTVSFGPTLFFGVSGITAFLASKRMDRHDIRWFYAAGGVVGALALWSLRLVNSVVDYYLFFAVFGISFSLAGLVPSTTIVARWFSLRRSVALSISSTGMSVGGIVITPAVAKLIDAEGLSGSSGKMAAGWFLGIVPIALFMLRSNPASVGLEPDGAPPPEIAAAPPGASFSSATRSRFFAMLSITYSLVFLAQVGSIAHLFSLAKERIGLDTAAVVLSALALSSVVARLVAGFVLLRFPLKRMTAILMVTQSVAMGLLALADSRIEVLTAAALFGATVGSLLMFQPLLIADAFGTKEYSRIYSLSQLAATIGVAGGPFLMGAIRDATSYQTAYIAGASANLIGLFFLAAAGSPSDAHRLWTEPAI